MVSFLFLLLCKVTNNISYYNITSNTQYLTMNCVTLSEKQQEVSVYPWKWKIKVSAVKSWQVGQCVVQHVIEQQVMISFYALATLILASSSSLTLITVITSSTIDNTRGWCLISAFDVSFLSESPPHHSSSYYSQHNIWHLLLSWDFSHIHNKWGLQLSPLLYTDGKALLNESNIFSYVLQEIKKCISYISSNREGYV